MGEDILKPIPYLISNIYENGEWTTHFTDVKMIALKKNPEATKPPHNETQHTCNKVNSEDK